MLNKKLFIIFSFIFFIVLFLVNENVYAFESNAIPQSVYDKALEVNHNSDNFVIFNDTRYNAFRICFQPSYTSELDTNSWRLVSGDHLKPPGGNTNGFIWVTYNDEGNINFGSPGTGEFYLDSNTTCHILYAKYNIGTRYNVSNNYSIVPDYVFFQLPPPIVEETTETIPALETVEQIPTAMVETVKTIIPVGLVILSIFLVIFLVRLVIYRVQ